MSDVNETLPATDALVFPDDFHATPEGPYSVVVEGTTYFYATKDEQEDAAKFLSAWVYPNQTARRDSLNEGFQVIISLP